MEKSKIIIQAYEDGQFSKMLKEYNSLPKEDKLHFIRYCKNNRLESVPLTILERKTYED